MAKIKRIFFKRLNEPYGEFSNFYESVMKIDGIKYPTVEHYYQSKKFEGTVFEGYIRHQSSPMRAKKLAYSDESKQYLQDDWERNKIQIMARGLFYKFKNPALKNLLLSTGDAEILEHSAKDFFWGTEKDEYDEPTDGSNVLGKMLMELRNRLRLEEDKNFIK